MDEDEDAGNWLGVAADTGPAGAGDVAGTEARVGAEMGVAASRVGAEGREEGTGLGKAVGFGWELGVEMVGRES